MTERDLHFRLNPRAVACPVIEEVNDKTLQYKFVTRDLVGVFHWNLDFDWREVERPDWAPYETPVMAGGLFTIRKDWFEELGFYDDGMEIWGGEQLELSFKVRMRSIICRCIKSINAHFFPCECCISLL